MIEKWKCVEGRGKKSGSKHIETEMIQTGTQAQTASRQRDLQGDSFKGADLRVTVEGWL